MAVGKSWAYLTEYGAEIVQAWEVADERRKYGNKPIDQVFWSNHQTGLRKPVVHKIMGKTTFFAYKSGEGGGGAGESLSHKLLKRAIAGMSGTKLVLSDGFGDHVIQVTYGETEKLIEAGPYRADAYLQFTSETWLSTRWSGEVYIEVQHKHAVPIEKEKALHDTGAAVVEVPLAEIFIYGENDETTTAEKEAAHVAWLRNLLQKGFLKGVVIADRISIEFLHQQVEWLKEDVKQLTGKLAAAQTARDEAAQQLSAANNRITEVEDTKTRLSTHVQAIRIQLDAARTDCETERGNAAGLASALGTAQAALAELRKGVRPLWWGLVAMTLALAAVVGTLAAHKFSSSANDVLVEAAAPAPQPHPAPASAASKPAKKINRGQPVKAPASTPQFTEDAP